uniref:NACHT domain-containing protein n=1 Tax=Erpetoichthys calabaricus TaxID=27687 RepID=A0A8C4ST24_ERPCA
CVKFTLNKFPILSLCYIANSCLMAQADLTWESHVNLSCSITLIVISHYKRTYNETHHELEKTGRTHAELVEERAKEKCERIWTEQLFRRSPGHKTPPYVVVVSGVAGIGKTTMVQKVMFDWTRGTQYKRFAFVFLFRFKDLNFLDNEKEPQMPLTRLIVRHYKYLNNPKLKEILKKPEHLLFIFDGLDEYRHKLDFTRERFCSDPEDLFPVHVLVTSLISGTLLKGCSVLITSRPTALESLDMKKVDRFAEILGFFPEQRLMYFKKFFGDTDLGTEAFQYVEDNAILYTMCFNPSYCWIMCSVLQRHFMTSKDERGVTPRTVTELFVMFLQNILTNHRREADDQRAKLVKLGKMAYYGVANRVLVFYDKFEMSTLEILQRESTLEHTTYTFFHLTLQEFMAALLLKNLDSCKDGRFEIFTRFLAGLARPSIFKILGEILGDLKRKTAKQILEWIKQKAERALQNRNKTEALQVCQWLYETQNEKLIRDATGKDLNMDFRNTTLSPLDCAVLASVISCCGDLQELNLSYSNLSPECIKRLEPGLGHCIHVNFFSCCVPFTAHVSTTYIISVLSRVFKTLPLTFTLVLILPLVLDLRACFFHYIHSFCLLLIFWLDSCSLTSGCCEFLSSVLSSEHSQMAEVQLDNNNLWDSGVSLLCNGLRNKNCKLKKMKLNSCHLTSGCCAALSSILSAEHSPLTVLELNKNNLGDSGVRRLCEGLGSPNCKLEKLSLDSCSLTSGCCESLSSVLSAEHSQMTELQLNNNNLEDSGMSLLCDGLRNKNCKLFFMHFLTAQIFDPSNNAGLTIVS